MNQEEILKRQSVNKNARKKYIDDVSTAKNPNFWQGTKTRTKKRKTKKLFGD